MVPYNWLHLSLCDPAQEVKISHGKTRINTHATKTLRIDMLTTGTAHKVQILLTRTVSRA